MTDVTLRQLEYAAAVARVHHFGRAAAACHATQPALSAAVAQLERALGVRLFDRGRRGAQVTEAGRPVLLRIEEVLARVAELRETARAGREPFSSPFRMGVIPTIAPFALPKAVPALRAHYPNLRLVLREDRTARLVRAIERGTIDAALLAVEADLGPCETIPLYRDPFLVAVPQKHRLAREKSVADRDLRSERLLLLEEGHCLRTQVLAVCERVGVAESADVRATSLSTLVHMAAGGLGITVLPAMATRGPGGDLAALRTIPFRGAEPFRTIGLAFRPSTARRAEIESVARVLRRSAPPGTRALPAE